MSAPATGYIRFTNANADYIDIDLPVRPYKSYIVFPFDIQRLEYGLYGVYDNGSAYDKRYCECTFELTATQTATLNDFLRTDGTSDGRGKELTLEMNADSGFYPFGPDKSPLGPHDVSVEVIRRKGVGEAPFKYFVVALRIRKSDSSWTAYSLPTEVNEGPMTIGTVTNCRFPQQWFSPVVRYGYYVTQTEGGETLFIDRGSNSDAWQTSATFIMNNSKTAAILDYITGTARAQTFSVIAGTDHYMFERDKGGNGTYTVRLIENIIEIEHTRLNQFTFKIALSWEATA